MQTNRNKLINSLEIEIFFPENMDVVDCRGWMEERGYANLTWANFRHQKDKPGYIYRQFGNWY